MAFYRSNVTVSIGPSGLSKAINISQGASGAVSSPEVGQGNAWAFNLISITSDGVDIGVPQAGHMAINGFDVNLTGFTSAARGIRHAINGQVIVSTQPSLGDDKSFYQYVGGQFGAQIGVSVGGSEGSEKGSVFGAGFSGYAYGNATNLENVTGAEANVAVIGNATTERKSGLSIANLASDTTRGYLHDAALSLSRIAGGVSWLNGILFSNYNGAHPCGADGTLIATQNSTTVLNGIDFSSYTFAGAPIIMPLMTPASASATGTAGSIKWDANYVYVCTATNTWKRAALSSW